MTTKNTAAAAALSANYEVVKSLLAEIAESARLLSEAPAAEVHWGHAGSMRHTIDELRDIAAFMESSNTVKRGREATIANSARKA